MERLESHEEKKAEAQAESLKPKKGKAANVVEIDRWKLSFNDISS
jgi:hypothetical protein